MIVKSDRRDRDRAACLVQRLLRDTTHEHASERSAMGGAEHDQIGLLFDRCVLQRLGGASPATSIGLTVNRAVEQSRRLLALLPAPTRGRWRGSVGSMRADSD